MFTNRDRSDSAAELVRRQAETVDDRRLGADRYLRVAGYGIEDDVIA